MILSFTEFQFANKLRCQSAFDTCKGWTMTEWSLAIAGETGELCNIVKKCIRGDFAIEEKKEDILKELADIITYCDLAVSYLNAATDNILIEKFNEVSKRINSNITL